MASKTSAVAKRPTARKAASGSGAAKSAKAAPKKKFKLFSAVLATVCIILVGDAVAPTASIGNSQYVWWILMLIGFFVPYALISAELGSQYPSEGGLYTWIKKAFGKKWASRVAWFYWVNFPLWIASLASLVTTLLAQMLGFELDWPVVLAIQVAYIALVTVLGTMRISQNEHLVNLGAIFKMLFMVALGVLGFIVLVTHGTANEFTLASMIPMLGEDGSFDFTGLGFVAIIIFNFLGFEVVTSFADDMENPRKEIPKAVILGGILVALFYLLASFGVGVAVPLDELSTDTGLLDSFVSLFTSLGLGANVIQAAIVIIGGMFIYTLIANISSWSFGVYEVVAYSAKDGAFPKSWAKTNKAGCAYNVSIWSGVVALVISVLGIWLGQVDENISNLFWTFFSLSMFTLLVSYVPMFFAFIKLHNPKKLKKDAYYIKGGRAKIVLMGIIPVILLLIALFFTLFPEFNMEMFEYNWPLQVGAVISVVIGEILVARMSAKDKQKKLARRK